MPITTRNLLDQYTEILQKIYGKHLKKVILYGSYARGDYRDDSDIDIMILLDLSDMDIKQYRHELSGETFDFNMDHDLDIKPIAKSQQHFHTSLEYVVRELLQLDLGVQSLYQFCTNRYKKQQENVDFRGITKCEKARKIGICGTLERWIKRHPDFPDNEVRGQVKVSIYAGLRALGT